MSLLPAWSVPLIGKAGGWGLVPSGDVRCSFPPLFLFLWVFKVLGCDEGEDGLGLLAELQGGTGKTIKHPGGKMEVGKDVQSRLLFCTPFLSYGINMNSITP